MTAPFRSSHCASAMRRDDRAEHLAEDHAGVAARAEQGATGERLEQGGPVGVAGRGLLADGVAGGGHGEVQVGAGVAVRHRVDVERVDLLAGAGQGVHRDVDEAEHGRELDAAPDGARFGSRGRD